ncbi:MAG TPA: alpha/beta hydrolase [Longimicrobiales bacterium]
MLQRHLVAAVAAALLGSPPPASGKVWQAPDGVRPAAAPIAPTRAYGISVAPGEVVHVEATGSGEPVVILPGLFGSAFGFRKIVEPIAALGHRVVVVEPLGVGASRRPRNADYSLEAQARRVAAALDSLHVSGATIVAHSVGNSIALRLALARPTLVHGIVSIEGGVAESAGTPGLRHALGFAGFLGHFGLEGVVTSRMRKGFHDSSGDPSWITDPVMAGYLAPLKGNYQDVIAGYKAMASAPERLALVPRLVRVRIPVELLLGAADHDGGPGEDEVALMRRLPELSIVKVPGAGHWIQEERPQAVIDAVRRVAAQD